MIVDAHQHVWDVGPGAYSWLGPHLAPINRTFRFAELEPELRAAGVSGTVLVQADDTDADTDHMLATADAHPEVLGVVGWVPLDDVDRAATRLETLRADPRVVGIRALIHDYADPDWIVGANVRAGLDLLAQAGMPYDYVTSAPDALRHLPTLGERHPELRLVVDHLGKPPVGGDRADFDRWYRLIAAAAENPLTHAKVSGLYSAVGSPADWTLDGIRPFFDAAVEVFGPSRLMFGGDWPVTLRAGGYARAWEASARLTADLTPGERAELYSGTAIRCYRLRTSGDLREARS